MLFILNIILNAIFYTKFIDLVLYFKTKMFRLKFEHVLLMYSFYVFMVFELVVPFKEILFSTDVGFFEFADYRVFHGCDMLQVFGRYFVVYVLLMLGLALGLLSQVSLHSISVFLLQTVFDLLSLFIDKIDLRFHMIHLGVLLQILPSFVPLFPIKSFRDHKFASTCIFLYLFLLKINLLLNQILVICLLMLN